MKLFHSILTGVLLWILIFALFTIMSFVPSLKKSETLQYMVLFVLLIPLVVASLKFYPSKNVMNNGILKGLVIVTVCSVLDAIITVPFIIIPQYEGSYADFFTNPLFIMTGVIIWSVVFFYSRSLQTHHI